MSLRSSLKDAWNWFGGLTPSDGAVYSFPRNAKDLGIEPVMFLGVKTVPAAAQCVRILSDSTASLPKYAVRRGEYPERLEGHPVTRLMEKPHPYINRTKWFRWYGDRVHGEGQGFAVIQRDRNGTPIALVPAIYSGTWTGENPIRMNSRIALQIPSEFVVGTLTSETRQYMMRDVLHVCDASYDPFEGLARSPLTQDAYNPIGRWTYLTKQFDDVMARGGYSNVLIQISRKELKDWQPTWEEEGGLVKIGNYDSLPEKAKINTIGRSPVEASLLDMLNAQVADIARSWNIPSTMIGLRDKGGQEVRGRPVLEEQYRNFVRAGYGTTVQGYADEFTLKLAPNGVRVHFDLNELTMGTMMDRASIVNMLVVDAGVFTVNEGRKLMGYPPKPGGDKLMQPRGAPTQGQSSGDQEMPEDAVKKIAAYTGEKTTRYEGPEGKRNMLADMTVGETVV